MRPHATKDVVCIGVFACQTQPGLNGSHSANGVILPRRILTSLVKIDEGEPLEEGQFWTSDVLLRFDVERIPRHVPPGLLDRDIVIAANVPSHEFEKAGSWDREDLVHVETEPREGKGLAQPSGNCREAWCHSR